MTVTLPDYKPAGEKSIYHSDFDKYSPYMEYDKAVMDNACKVKFIFTSCRLDFGNLTTYKFSYM